MRLNIDEFLVGEREGGMEGEQGNQSFYLNVSRTPLHPPPSLPSIPLSNLHVPDLPAPDGARRAAFCLMCAHPHSDAFYLAGSPEGHGSQHQRLVQFKSGSEGAGSVRRLLWGGAFERVFRRVTTDVGRVVTQGHSYFDARRKFKTRSVPEAPNSESG